MDTWIREVEKIGDGLVPSPDRRQRLESLLNEIEATTFQSDQDQEELAKLGYVLYRASLTAINEMKPKKELEDEKDEYFDLALRAATIYRRIPSPDIAAYGLLAIRAASLAYSKHETDESFYLSRYWIYDCSCRADRYLQEHSGDDDVTRLRLLEVIEQIELAETGTWARIAEDSLANWSEIDHSPTSDDARRLVSWHCLNDGIRHGQSSIAKLLKLQETKRLRTGARNWEQISTVDWQFRPYLMTARCHLTAVVYCWLFARGSSAVPQFVQPGSSWVDEVEYHLKKSRRLFAEMMSAPGRNVNVTKHMRREIAQVGLHLALLFPGKKLFLNDRLFTILDEPSPEGTVSIVEALSLFLCRKKYDANIIGSITDDKIIDVIEENAHGYKRWAKNWCCLARLDSPRRRNCPTCVHR